MAGFADRQPATLTTTADTVQFRSGSTRFPTTVLINWDGGDAAVVGVGAIDEPNGLAVLTTLDDLARMRDAITAILQRAEGEAA